MINSYIGIFEVIDRQLVKFLGTMGAAFVAGWAAHSGIYGSPLFGGSATDWHKAATANGWIAKGECTAAATDPKPIVLNIVDPPSDASGFHLANGTLREPITVTLSRPLEDGERIGVEYAEEFGQRNFAVVWPDYRSDGEGRIRIDTPDFPFTPDRALPFISGLS